MGENKIFINGVSVARLNFREVLEDVRKYLEKLKTQNSKLKTDDRKPLIIFTPNPEIIVYAQKDQEFKRTVNSAQINIPDGQGLIWASRFLGKPLPERIVGTDLLERLAELAAKNGLSIGLIGGGPEIAVKALECLRKKYPDLLGWGEEGPWIKDGEWRIESREWNEKIGEWARKIRERRTDVLFVGFGAPKQEYFIYHLSSLIHHPIVLMAVGGAFDYLSGKIPRAPKWVRGLGFEWLYRLFRQPWRWRRQLALFEFIFLVLKEKFSRQRV